MKLIRTIPRVLRRLHADERGSEGLEKLLIFGAIILPLLAIIIIFGDDFIETLEGWWEDVKGSPPEPPNL